MHTAHLLFSTVYQCHSVTYLSVEKIHIIVLSAFKRVQRLVLEAVYFEKKVFSGLRRCTKK